MFAEFFPTASPFCMAMKKRKKPRHIPGPARKTRPVSRMFNDACRDLEANKPAAAEKGFAGVLQVEPGNVQALLMLGICLARQEKFDKATERLNTAIRLAPARAELYLNLAVIRYQQGKMSDAIDLYRKVTQLAPGNADVWYSLGYIYARQNRVDEAIYAYEKSIFLGNRKGKVYVDLGVLLATRNDFGKIQSIFSKAIRETPGNGDLLSAFAAFYIDLSMHDASIEYLEKALELVGLPDERKAGLLFVLQDAYKETMSWARLRRTRDEINELAGRRGMGRGAVLSLCRPFSSIDNYPDYRINYESARLCVNNMTRPLDPARRMRHGTRRSSRSKDRIVVGYMSPDFRNHPVGQIMSGLLPCHDRHRFEIHAYSLTADNDSSYRKVIERESDLFADIRQLNYQHAAQMIHGNGVDILVDLAGHTTHNRMQILYYRPAPVQITFLGFPCTTGADFVDYIVVDQIVAPEDSAIYFAEKFIYMPGSYFTYDNTTEISAKKYARDEQHLPADRFVFACFCRTSKIEPALFDAWMRIMARVPGSVLWLASTKQKYMEKIRSYARQKGIDSDRIIFASRMERKEDHMARLCLADLALDTVPYNGHTTSCDLIWAGVPVLSVLGTHFASRVSASVLHTLDVPELVCADLQEYVERAVYYAGHQADLQSVRDRIRERMADSSVFNTPRFVRNLESAYRRAWEMHIEKEDPSVIRVGN